MLIYSPRNIFEKYCFLWKLPSSHYAKKKILFFTIFFSFYFHFFLFFVRFYVHIIFIGGGGRSAIQIKLGVDAVTAGGGGGGADCYRTTGCGGGGKLLSNETLWHTAKQAFICFYFVVIHLYLSPSHPVSLCLYLHLSVSILLHLLNISTFHLTISTFWT